MYGTEINFKLNVPLDDDDCESIECIIRMLQDIINTKKREIELAKLYLNKPRRKVHLLSIPENEEEELKQEIKTSTGTPNTYHCEYCNMSVLTKNRNRHLQTRKHKDNQPKTE